MISPRQRMKVAPCDGILKIEIRIGRHIRVQHFNAYPRDAKFEKEMQMYMQYRQNGIRPSGPLSMPRRQATNMKPKYLPIEAPIQPDPHPNFISPNEKTRTGNKPRFEDKTSRKDTVLTITDVVQDFRSSPENIKNVDSNCVSVSSSVVSSPSHLLATEKNIRSASSVLLGLHLQSRQEQQNEKVPKVEISLPGNVAEDKYENNETLTIITDERGDDNKAHVIYANSFTSEAVLNDVSMQSSFLKNQKQRLSPVPVPQVIQGNNDSVGVAHNSAIDKDIALFFIHGVGGSSDTWSNQTNYFTNLGFEVIAPDLIGHGMSCAPKDAKAYQFKEICADLESLFDRFCKRKNVLIGHSYGASFVTHLARYRSRRVTKLILISGGPPTPLAPQPGVFSLPTCLLGCISPCLKRGFYKGAFHDRKVSKVPKERAFKVPTKVLQNTMNGQDWPDGDEIFHTWLTCPSLLIYGAQDKLVSLQEEEYMAQCIFDCHLEVIKEASHMVMMEAPDDVNQLIHRFMGLSGPVRGCFSQNTTGNASIPQTSCDTPPPPQRSKSPPPLQRSKSPLPVQRSKSRMSQRSLKSAKVQRSLPNNLLRKSLKT